MLLANCSHGLNPEQHCQFYEVVHDKAFLGPVPDVVENVVLAEHKGQQDNPYCPNVGLVVLIIASENGLNWHV